LEWDVVAAQHGGSGNDTADAYQHQNENQQFTGIVIEEIGQMFSPLTDFPQAPNYHGFRVLRQDMVTKYILPSWS